MTSPDPRWISVPLLVLTLGLAGGCTAPAKSTVEEKAAFVLGTWTGTSTCVGDRPACKDETVVYRFEPIPGQPGQVRQYADKILDGKRVPMGKLDYQVDLEHHSVRSEFRVGHTHGIWEYSVDGDAMTGRVVILPENSIGRDVSVRRVDEDAVPSAPPLNAYDE